MKVFQATAPRQGAFTEERIPTPVEDQILVKVSYCGVCGTDYDLFSGESSFVKNNQATFPIRLGHEWSGVVAQVGPKATRLKPGDRVVGDNYVSCGVCDACKAGNYNNCTGRKHVGTIDPCWPGAYAEYYLAPERHVYRLADHVSLKEASLCEPLSVAYGGIKKMDITEKTVVAVIGTGPIALSAAALALNQGGKVYVIGRNDFKLEIARKLGIHGVINCSRCDVAAALQEMTGGRLADCILECSGNPDMVGEVIRIAAPKAKAALIGFYNVNPREVDFSSMVAKEMTMVGIMGEYGNLETVSGILAEKDLKLSQIVTSVVPFSECAEALSPADPHHVVKTIVQIAGEQ